MTDEATIRLIRLNNSLLGGAEQRVIAWLVKRLPNWVTPDRLTALGAFGAVLILVGYAAYACLPSFLWLANLGLAIHWFGDSLDGSLARYRRIERPRYGFYLDNSLDILTQLMLAIGLALSGLVRTELALLALCAFYMLAQLSLIRAQVSGIFLLAYGLIGTTELRIVFIIFNIAVLIFPPRSLDVLGLAVAYPNLISGLWIGLMLATFVTTMVSDLRRLAVDEPPRSGADGQGFGQSQA